MEDRRTDRHDISAQGKFRAGMGLALSVNVSDLNAHGCKLTDIPRNMATGDRISLRIGSIGPIEALVRWVERSQAAGLEFETPLHDAILAHVVEQNRTATKAFNAEISHYESDLSALKNRRVAARDEALRAQAISVASSSVTEPAPPAPEPEAKPVSELMPPERRQDIRRAHNEDVMLFDETQRPAQAAILDKSTTGYRIQFEGDGIEVGSTLGILFGDNRLQEGEVVWNYGSMYGVRLKTDIDELVAGSRSASETAIAPAGENSPTVSMIAKDMPNLPTEQLQKFLDLFEAAKQKDYSVVHIRIEEDAIEMVVSSRQS